MSLKDKLKLMASLAGDFAPPEEEKHDIVLEGVSDETTFYDMDFIVGTERLGSFLDCQKKLFFGLNDVERDRVDIDRVLFLDTETTGLFGAAVQAFLVGVGYFENGRFAVRQLLMRDITAEEEQLALLDSIWKDFDVIVTFNGKSYDMPLLLSRFAFLRMEPSPPAIHIDLIHPARRIYKLRIESCSLSNIERRVFLSGRVDDIDGAEIPGRYFRYLRLQDPSLLDDILEHNRQDIVSMPMLASAMCRLLECPTDDIAGADRFSIGRYYLRQDDPDTAAKYLAGVDDAIWRIPALWQLSMTKKKAGDIDAAVELWLRLLECVPDYCPALIELSKYCEHKFRDIPRAIEYCDAALNSDMGRSKRKDELDKRRARLAAKYSKELYKV